MLITLLVLVFNLHLLICILYGLLNNVFLKLDRIGDTLWRADEYSEATVSLQVVSHIYLSCYTRSIA